MRSLRPRRFPCESIGALSGFARSLRAAIVPPSVGEMAPKFTDARGRYQPRTPWPTYDSGYLFEDEGEIVPQINGKVRESKKMSILAPEEEINTGSGVRRTRKFKRLLSRLAHVIVVPKLVTCRSIKSLNGIGRVLRSFVRLKEMR